MCHVVSHGEKVLAGSIQALGRVDGRRTSCIVLMHRLCTRSQIMMDLSSDTEIKSFPLGWNNTVRTQLSCPTCRDCNRPRGRCGSGLCSRRAAAPEASAREERKRKRKKSEGAVRGS